MTAQAKSIPTVALNLKTNVTNGHVYFSPTYSTITPYTVYVTINNTTKQSQIIGWGKNTTIIQSGKSKTALQTAYNIAGFDDTAYAILIDLLYPNKSLEAQAGLCVAYICPDY
jgi:hypothetical protein